MGIGMQLSGKSATCKECKKTGHFTKMPGCTPKKINCIKIGAVNSTMSTNVVDIMATSYETSVPIKLEAGTGVNITVMRAEQHRGARRHPVRPRIGACMCGPMPKTF